MNLFKSSSWGVHALEQASEKGLYQVSYFLSRPFGNHLIFPLQINTAFQDDFIKAKGGVAFQFLIHPDRATEAQIKMFNHFGAPLVHLCGQKDIFDPRVRIIKPGTDFYDPDVEVVELASAKALAIRSKNVTLVFFASPFVLDRGVIRHTINFKEVREFTIESSVFPWKATKVVGFFQFYRGRNWIDLSSMLE
jgi:hypothetical protein